MAAAEIIDEIAARVRATAGYPAMMLQLVATLLAGEYQLA
jgi:hypothetical protein